MEVVATNRKAYYDYSVIDTVEAGIVLTGTEIKSIRAGSVNLKESYARLDEGEVFVYGMHISPYDKGNRYNTDPLRTRKLLLHKYEILKLIGKVKERGFALVPLKLVLKRNRAKIELGLVKGKKLYDKRRAIAKKDAARMQQFDLKERLKNN